MIRLENLTLGYGSRTLLDGVSAVIPGGALTALVGRNGTGKSTLLRALVGLERIRGGRVLLDGRELARIEPRRLAATAAFVATGRVRIPNLRCRDVVAFGRAPYTNWFGRMQAEDAAIVGRALEAVGMEGFADRALDTMSDGECQRVMIARALAQQTPVILLDEPTSFLDLPNRYELCSLLRRLAHEEGKCILFSTHELDIALSLCDAVALIDPPRLHCLPTDEMIRSGRIERLFGRSAVRFDAATGTVKIVR